MVGVHALVALLTPSALLTLFVFRALDDNTLTSWRWVFAEDDLARIVVLLGAALALAGVAARSTLAERHPKAALFLLSFVAGAACWSEPEVIVDAGRYFTQAKHVALYGVGYFVSEWGREIPAWTDLPLVPFLYGVVFSLWGETRTAIQLFTTLLFSGTVVLTYLIGKALWGETVGFFGGALLLGMPYLVTQVPLMLVDVPTMFFLALAIWAAVLGLERGGTGRIAGAAVALALALLSKYSAWPLLTVVPVIALVHGRKAPGAAVRRGMAIVLLGLGLIGIFLLLRRDVISTQLGLLQGYQVPGLRRWRESFASTFFFQIHPLITAAAAYSLVRTCRKREWAYAVVAWPVLLLLALQVERSRYLLPVLPLLALMAAYGLEEIGGAATRRFAAASIVTSSLAVAVFAYVPHLAGTSAANLKEAGRFLDTLEADTVEVYVLAQPEAEVNPAISVPLLDLFTSKRLVYRGPAIPPPSREAIATSPLRFTWEYRSPAYYTARSRTSERGSAIVIIAGRADPSLPDEVERRVRGHRLSRTFRAPDPWFRFRTLVSVYLPTAETGTERGG